MTLPTLTGAELLTGVGEFAPISEHELKSLLQIEDLDKGLEGAIANVKTAAGERLTNDMRDLDGFDPSEVTLTTAQGKVIKAAWAHLIMHNLLSSSVLHKDDYTATNAKYHLQAYERIRARIVYLMPAGNATYSGSGGRLVRG